MYQHLVLVFYVPRCALLILVCVIEVKGKDAHLYGAVQSSPVQSSLWIMEWLKTDLSKLLQFYRKLFRLYATKLSFQSRKRKKERESVDWWIIMCGTEFRIHSCQYSPCLSHTDNGNSSGKFSSANLFSWKKIAKQVA